MSTSQPASVKRFPQITLDTLPDKDAKALAQEILDISSIGLAGPYNVMLRSPIFARRIKDLLDYLRFNTSLPKHLNEFAILIQGRLWSSQVEWHAHYPIALKAGLRSSIADDLKANIRPRDMHEDEAIVYDVCMDLSTKHKISDDYLRRAAARRSGCCQRHLYDCCGAVKFGQRTTASRCTPAIS